MREEPLVSVVIPAYNCARFIEQAIRSVYRQSYPRWEIVAVEDASEDATRSILERLAGEESRLRLFINAKNVGVSASRNRAVLEARGEYIAFLDGDDVWQSDKLEKQLKRISEKAKENKRLRLVFTGSGFIDETGRSADRLFSVPEKVGFSELLRQNVISCSSVLAERDLLLRYPMPEQPGIHEDYAVWLQLLKAGTEVEGINEALLLYRVTKGSKSGNKWKSAKMNWRTYRYIGVPFFQRISLMLVYAVRGSRKWLGILRALRKVG